MLMTTDQMTIAIGSQRCQADDSHSNPRLATLPDLYGSVAVNELTTG